MNKIDKKTFVLPSVGDLIDAVITNDVLAVKRLLESGADPNGYEDEAKIRPLHFAAQHNALQSAVLLLQAGADIHAQTSDGATPKEVAQINHHEDMIQLLGKIYGSN